VAGRAIKFGGNCVMMSSSTRRSGERACVPHQNRRFLSLSRPARFFGGKHRFYGGKGIGRGPVSPDTHPKSDGRERPGTAGASTTSLSVVLRRPFLFYVVLRRNVPRVNLEFCPRIHHKYMETMVAVGQ
jgi:hypothetical protein